VASDDDVYASYFRPEPPEPVGVPDEPLRVPDDPGPADELPPADPPATDADGGSVAGDEFGEPAVEPAPAAAPGDSAADTGRLFRSQGVVGHEVAVLALASDHGGRLRTLAREGGDSSASAGSPAGSPVEAGDDPDIEAGKTRVRRERRTAGSRAGGISAGAVYIIVFGLTLAVAFVNAWLASGTLGWPTGVALVVASVYCALRVRREDDVVAMITPPLAFFVAAITAGQLLLGAQAGSTINRAQKVFFTLADNWYWIIGATLAAVIIVLVRRRRS
jgi:hypothetical protein